MKVSKVSDVWKRNTVREHARTVVAAFENLDSQELMRALNAGGGIWRQISLKSALHSKSADVVALGGRHSWDSRFWRIRSEFKSRLVASGITNKVDLHALLAKCAPSIVPETALVATHLRGPPVLPPGVWVWRTEFTRGKQKMAIVAAQQDLCRAWKFYKNKHFKHKRVRSIMTRYLEPALTDSGAKFHVRMYLLVTIAANGRRRAALYNDGLIAIARAPYATGHYNNNDIHDTSALGGHFPADFPGSRVAEFTSQAVAIVKTVTRLAMSGIASYPESDASFEILEANFMMDSTGKVWLLGINAKPDFGSIVVLHKQGFIQHISQYLFGGLCEFVLNPSAMTHRLKFLTLCYDSG